MSPRTDAATGEDFGWEGEATGLARPVDASQLDTRHGDILYLDDITVSFDGFRALNKLTLDIAVGELRCIIGPNGAGKTTMMDVITGKTRPDAGTAFFGQTIDLTRLNEPTIAQIGIGRKFQKPTVFEAMTVAENLEIALKTDKSVWASLRARLTGQQRDRIDEPMPLGIRAIDAMIPCGRGQRLGIFAGSGVGKSTMVNRLVPQADRATGEVSGVGKGRHTSTQSVALPIPDSPGTWVVDTPGIRSFGLAHISPDDVVAAFTDLREAIEDCPRGCSHLGPPADPECALDQLDGAAARRAMAVRNILVALTAENRPAVTEEGNTSPDGA